MTLCLRLFLIFLPFFLMKGKFPGLFLLTLFVVAVLTEGLSVYLVSLQGKGRKPLSYIKVCIKIQESGLIIGDLPCIIQFV